MKRPSTDQMDDLQGVLIVAFFVICLLIGGLVGHEIGTRGAKKELNCFSTLTPSNAEELRGSPYQLKRDDGAIFLPH